MSVFRRIAAFIGFTATITLAHASPPPEVMGARIDIPTMLGLDARRAGEVLEILEAARGKMYAAQQRIGEPRDEATRAALDAAFHAVRTEANQKLAKVLTPAEMDKVRASVPPQAMRH